MDDIILSFLQAYKKLDRLCRNLLSAENGVPEYIEAMYNASRATGWRGKKIRLTSRDVPTPVRLFGNTGLLEGSGVNDLPYG